MSPPQCRYPGCSTACSELSTSLRARWQEVEGLAWDWVSPRRAYFNFCEEHHKQLWPLDRRVRNRYSGPSDSTMHRAIRGGVRRLIASDLYITQAPPEYVFGPGAKPSPAPARGRSRSCRPKPRKEVTSRSKRVSWGDGGKWVREAAPSARKPKGDVANSRSHAAWEANLREAELSSLVTLHIVDEAACEVDRACVPYMCGPCDGCGSDMRCEAVAGMFQCLQSEVYQKETIFLCLGCRVQFFRAGAIRSEVFQEDVVRFVSFDV